MNKTIIAVKGIGEQGKSTTIKLLTDLIKTTYPHTETVYEDNGDIKVILEVKGLKIGIESQGDPNSRQAKSINDFITENCQIIICSSRTSGHTVWNILDTVKHDYRIIWTTNYNSKEVSHVNLNKLSAKHLLELFDNLLTGSL